LIQTARSVAFSGGATVPMAALQQLILVTADFT
jgi:hypothetical protein